jgi:hypothetical protein
VNRPNVQRAALAALALMALVSLGVAATNALGTAGSKDFQYSGAHYLASGIDPYAVWNTTHKGVLLAQVPNYLPALYFLLLPIGALTWPVAKAVWLACNLGFAGFIAWRLWRQPARHGQPGPTAQAGVWMALLFLSSAPVRNTINNGQMGLLILTATIWAFSARSNLLRGMLIALALTKYSLGAVFAALFVARRQWIVVAVAGAVTLAAYGLLAAITGSPFNLALLLAPLETARGGVLLDMPFSGLVALAGSAAPLIVSAITLAAVMIWAWRRAAPRLLDLRTAAVAATEPGQLPRMVLVASLATLGGMPHLNYDFVFLALPFMLGNPFALVGRAGRMAYAVVLAWHWNALKLVPPGNLPLKDVATLVMTGLMLFVAVDAARRGGVGGGEAGEDRPGA